MKIQKIGAVVVEHSESFEELGPLLKKLIVMREERFRAVGRPDMPPLWKNFYYALATRQSRTLRASITTMKVSDEVVATCFGLTRGNTYYAILPTFEMGKWQNYRPGMLLFDAMLTSFAEKVNYDGYFDFTVGDETYKKRFGCESYSLYEWMTPRSLRGLAYYVTWRAALRLRRYPRVLGVLKACRSRLARADRNQ